MTSAARLASSMCPRSSTTKTASGASSTMTQASPSSCAVAGAATEATDSTMERSLGSADSSPGTTRFFWSVMSRHRSTHGHESQPESRRASGRGAWLRCRPRCPGARRVQGPTRGSRCAPDTSSRWPPPRCPRPVRPGTTAWGRGRDRGRTASTAWGVARDAYSRGVNSGDRGSLRAERPGS